MAERKISKRKWPGNVPQGDGWTVAGHTVECYGVRWIVSVQDHKASAVWQNVKISAGRPVVTKGNYRAGWTGERLAWTRDTSIMKSHRPDLEAAVVAVLTDWGAA